MRHVAAGADARCVAVTSPFSGRLLARVPASTPADVVRVLAPAAGNDPDLHAAWRALRPARRIDVVQALRAALAVRRPDLAAALRHGSGLGPPDAADELLLADRLVARCARAARRNLPPARSVPASVTSHADPGRPLLSLLEGALPALLAGAAVTTAVDVRTAPVAALAAEAARTAGLADGAWRLVVAGSEAAADVHATLAEHTRGVAPQCCPPPHRPRRPGLLVLRHDGDARAAALAAVAAVAARAGRHCAATRVVAVHAARWGEFLTGLTRSAGPTRSAGRGGPAGEFREGGPAFVTVSGLDRVVPADVPAGSVVVVAPFTAWAEVLHLARETGSHAAVFTRTRRSQLAPQFDTLPAARVVLNDRPRAGLSPRAAFRALGDGPLR